MLPIRYRNLIYIFSKTCPVKFKDKYKQEIFFIQEEVNETLKRSQS